MISHPEYLSKDRLKNELKSHGVKFNNNENKQYYVKLYRKHIMETDEDRQQTRSEFSSDEEFVKRTAKPEKKQSPKKRKTVKIDTYLPDIQELSDSELMDELARFGEDCGPITDSTRGVYQRKLAKLMAEKATGKLPVSRTLQPPQSSEDEDEENTAQNESYVGEWSSEEEEIVEVRPTSRRSPRTSIVGKGVRDTGIRERPKREPVDDRPNPPVAKGPPKPIRRNPPTTNTSSSFLCSFLILLVVFATVFFVYEHYTTSEGTPSLAMKSWDKIRDFVVKVAPNPDKESPTSTPASDKEPTETPKAKPASESSKTTKPKTADKASKPKSPGKPAAAKPAKGETPPKQEKPKPASKAQQPAKGASKPSAPKASKAPTPKASPEPKAPATKASPKAKASTPKAKPKAPATKETPAV